MFSFRKFISISVFLVFLVCAITGLVLLLSPHGKSGSLLLGLSKREYVILHITSSITFIVMSIIHIIYNWNYLTDYLSSRSKKFKNLPSMEFLVGIIFCIFLIWGTRANLPPFSWILKISNEIKSLWS